MESEIPADVRNSRMVVACVIGPDGVLRNLRVLESEATDMSAKILAALQGWRFRPVLRGDQAIAVDAILGFDIDTR
jgi:outer membrane biosynthesis protein TonB